MKRFAGVIAGIAGVLIVTGGGCGYSALDTARKILNSQFISSNLSYKTFRWCTNGLPFVDKIENLLEGKYIILLQNNTELRPSGGFIGSYAAISTDKRGVKQIRVQDIYEPDGKLPGHVEPPYPVQEAFGQGWWKLRDANWDPDFASAAGTVKWFMEQGGETDVKGLMAVNLGLVNRLIGVYGPIKLATYDEIITDKNFYGLAQKYAETRRADDTTDKRGFLGAAGAALEERIKAGSVNQLIRLISVIFSELKKGEILVWMRDPEIQKEIEFRGWGGRLTDNWNSRDDYLYIVEANLGANKANCCIDRDLRIEIEKTTNKKIAINWRNNNEFEHPKPPIFWGGNYRNYVRIIVPKDKNIVSVSVSGKILGQATDEDFSGPNALRQGLSEDIYVVEPRENLQIIGFWAVVEAKHDLRVEIETESQSRADKMLVKHQPGSGVTNYQVVVDGVIKESGRLDRDLLVSF